MASTEPPARGEVWLVAFGAGRRGEPDRNRPAVVVSADHLSQGAVTDLIAVVPLSVTLSPSALRPEVSVSAGVDRPSRAICRGIRGVSASRVLRRLGALERRTLADVDRALALVLALDRTASAAP
jgi:mRNA interferase MazF